MPGTHLNDTERHLLRMWRDEKNPSYPSLRRLSIIGDKGLRGIRNLTIDFNYPLTVICGRNGSGKSTILALTALGYHSPKGHIPVNATHHPKGNWKTAWYTFSDFFFRGPDDPDITGIKITWTYNGADSLPIEKKSDKWMHYDRRPKRPVDYLGILRCIPAIEQKVLRLYFSDNKKIESTRQLNQSYCRRFSDIMGRSYEGADVLYSSSYSLRKCRYDSNSFSSFNLGSGEDILINFLSLLQECDENSLIVVEEIEMGLHPEALIRLAKHLQEIILEKKLQVIVSTHSSYFIDSVPRQSRILIQRDGSERDIIYEPTTRFAMGTMAGRVDPELNLYCEDNVAAIIIEQALLGNLLRRINILPVGSNTQLIPQAISHLKARIGRNILVLWDGEVEKRDAEHWIRDQKINTPASHHIDWNRLNWSFLPGNMPPDKWMLEELNCENGHQLLSHELGIGTSEASELIELLRGLDEHHDIGFELKNRTNIGGSIGNDEEAIRILARSLRKLDDDPLRPIRDAVESVLNGEKIPNTNDRIFLG